MSQAKPQTPRKGKKGNFEIFRVITAPEADHENFRSVERDGLTPRGNPLLNSAFGRDSVWTAADLKGAFEFATENDVGAMGKNQKGAKFFRIYRGKLDNQEFYRPTPESNFADIYQNVYNQFQAVKPTPLKPTEYPDDFIRKLFLTSNYAKSTQPQKSKEIIVKGDIKKDVRQVFPEEGSISFEDFREHPEHPRFTRVKGKVIPYTEWKQIKNSERPTRQRPVTDFLSKQQLVDGDTPLYAAVKAEITDSVKPTRALRDAFKELEETQPKAFPPLPPLPPPEEPLPPLPEAGGK